MNLPQNPGKLPRHIAVIMDGNGRWARSRGLSRAAGHRKGVEAIRKMIPTCGRHAIPYLTLFAFSSENWKRPDPEVKFLIELLTRSLEDQVAGLHDQGIRLRIIGDISRFPERLQRSVADANELTRDNTALNLTIAINYGGQWDLQQACQSIAGLVEKGELSSSSITPVLIESQLCTRDLPQPDLFIRTGGEQRISNFLLWQIAYTELYFTETFWPDFDEECFERALEWYASRQRRFGRIEAQIETEPISGAKWG